MPPRTDNLARPGDRVYRVSCCDAPVLVKEAHLPKWECGRCYGPARPSKLYEFDKQMNLIELSIKEGTSYRD